jgi:hypothetical protein
MILFLERQMNSRQEGKAGFLDRLGQLSYSPFVERKNLDVLGPDALFFDQITQSGNE